MKLHEDRDAFLYMIEEMHKRTGQREDVLEKDYYVVLFLKELEQMQAEGLPAYFKGGTALYKALKTTKRFSEDIDLSVDTRDCSRSQNGKRLEKAAKKYQALPRNTELGRTNRPEVVAIYSYEPLVKYQVDDVLNRFGTIMVEATSFTISEPVEEMEISALLYELASEEEKEKLRDVYGMEPFMVKTITLERVFVDKLFAAEAYLRSAAIEKKAFEAAKHIYDLSVMRGHEKIIRLLEDEDLLGRLLDIRMEEEKGGFTFDDVCDEACKKLIRRHPHVFGDATADTPEQVLTTWDAVKRQEKQQKSTGRAMADVADALPALWRAEKIQSKAAKDGFDWEDWRGPREKLNEEIGELDEAIAAGGDIESELGDVLATVVNLARHLGIDPEKALGGACDRFVARYSRMEELAGDKPLAEHSPDEREAFWEKAKAEQSHS